MTNYKPTGKHDLTPYLAMKDAAKAIEFYKKAFGAEEIARLNFPDGKIMHAAIKIGDSTLMLADEFQGKEDCGTKSSETLKGANATLHLYVQDVDKAFERATAAGAKPLMPPTDMFWGDRYGRLVDPFGQPWSLATHKEDLSVEEMQKRGNEFCKQMAMAK